MDRQMLTQLVGQLNGNIQIDVFDAGITIKIAFPPTKRQAQKGEAGDSNLFTDANGNAVIDAWNWVQAWRNLWELRNSLTKKVIKEYIHSKLASNDIWAQRALVVIYEFQTAEEQRMDRTVMHNGVGFSGHDAEILSSFAKQVQDRMVQGKRESGKYLSNKQLAFLRKTIKKYWQQIWNVTVAKGWTHEIKLLRQVAHYKNAGTEQTNLFKADKRTA